jgi:release factor glutamine methyltransferase
MQRIKSALDKATLLLSADSDSAALDAEILLCFILNKERTYLRTWPDFELETEQTDRYWTLIQERQKGRPIAYITGHREFWSRDFLVTPDVLIPRPDTELLIELCLTLIPDNTATKIIDLGTGSGIIAVTLAAERPLAQISATDLSFAALHIAQINANKHQTTINFLHSDWLDNVPTNKFDLIISNPPYIAEYDKHLSQGDLRFEPLSALRASDQGLSDIKIIADNARDYLELGGYLLIEHGYDQQQAVEKIFIDYDYKAVITAKDLSGQPRVTYGQWLKI